MHQRFYYNTATTTVTLYKAYILGLSLMKLCYRVSIGIDIKWLESQQQKKSQYYYIIRVIVVNIRLLH